MKLEKYSGNIKCECDYGLCNHTAKCNNLADWVVGDKYLCKVCLQNLKKDGIF